MSKTLECEANEYIALHKFTILFVMIKKYYLALQAAGTPIDDVPDKLAQRKLARLVMLPDNLATFNRLYEQAWEELREYAI